MVVLVVILEPDDTSNRWCILLMLNLTVRVQPAKANVVRANYADDLVLHIDAEHIHSIVYAVQVVFRIILLKFVNNFLTFLFRDFLNEHLADHAALKLFCVRPLCFMRHVVDRDHVPVRD